MNDFQASALGIDQLQEKDRVVLNAGAANPNTLQDNAVRVAVGAGTGLGLAWLQGTAGAAHAFDTEGGHIDFAGIRFSVIGLDASLMFVHTSGS